MVAAYMLDSHTLSLGMRTSCGVRPVAILNRDASVQVRPCGELKITRNSISLSPWGAGVSIYGKYY